MDGFLEVDIVHLIELLQAVIRSFEMWWLQVLNIKSDKTEITDFTMEDLELIEYNSHKKIAMDMSV